MLPCVSLLKLNVFTLNLPGTGFFGLSLDLFPLWAHGALAVQVLLQRFLHLQRQTHHLKPFWAVPGVFMVRDWVSMCYVRQCRSITCNLRGLSKKEVAGVGCGFTEVSSAGQTSKRWLRRLVSVTARLYPQPALPWSNTVTFWSDLRF